MNEGDKFRFSRRAALRGGGTLALAVFLPVAGGQGSAIAVTVDESGFLTEDELVILRALADRIVPGQPEDRDPGAVAAGCADAIDALLAAFSVDPPRIFAGAPFSDRAGSPVNHFEDFLPLDVYEAKAWRLQIEGSKGRPELEFNGPVAGFQAVYREGLGALGPQFAAAPGPMRDVILRTSSDPKVKALLDIAVPHTMQFMYGAPEYGGNADLVGWEYTGYEGDVQPRGYTREQVENPDNPGLPELLPDPPVPLADLLAITPLATTEVVMGMQARSGGEFSGMRSEVLRVLKAARKGFGHGA